MNQKLIQKLKSRSKRKKRKKRKRKTVDPRNSSGSRHFFCSKIVVRL